MFVKRKTSRRTKTKIIGLTAALTLIGGVAFAYWVGLGSGSGSETNAARVLDVVVSQAAATNLAPGESVDLSGLLTNPNNTDVKVGTLTATITGVTGPNGPATMSDFAISGNGVVVNAVVKKGAPLAWSGMKLTYANSAVNQDTGKSAAVTISYALTPFVEGVVIPMGTKTITTVNGLRTVTIKIDGQIPGQQLSFWMGNGAPNGYACAGTTSTYCNLVAPAPVTVNYVTQEGTVNASLPKVDANGVLFFQGPMSVAVQWQFLSGATIGTL